MRPKYLWLDGKIVPWKKGTIHLATPGVQYGLGGFEGIRFYRTDKGPAIFRLPEHLARFSYPHWSIGTKTAYSEEELICAIKRLIRKTGMEEGYIRPVSLLAEETLGIERIGKLVKTAIILWHWEKGLRSEAVSAKISKVRRIHPASLDVCAKVNGHYVNSRLAILDVQNSGSYDKAILLDHKGYVAEAAAENIFMVKNGILITPSCGAILPGITRDTIMILARDYLGRDVVREKKITPDELLNGDEVFLCGTAAEILPVGSIDGIVIGDGKPGKTTRRLQALYSDVARGKIKLYARWLTYVR